jgi:ferritin-like metal-binding protein YciE
MKTIKSLRDVLLFELNALYHTEKRILKFFEKLIGSIHSPDLENAVANYMAQSESRLNKLKWAFEYLSEEKDRSHNRIIEVLLDEMEQVINETESDSVRDAILIGNIQKVCHYKISVYGTCAAYAHELREHEAEEIFKEILALEKETDKGLSALAFTQVNDDALATELR